jgi:two-component system, LuxR family, response regulator FixJ
MTAHITTPAPSVNQTVFVVDDDAATRKSIEEALVSVGLHAEVYATVGDLIDHVSPERPGCVIIDVHSETTAGVDAQRLLKTRSCLHPVIIVTGQYDVPAAVLAMREGAIDVLPRPVNAQHLIDDVHRALTLDQSQRKKADGVQELKRRYAQLTVREQEVMSLVIAGGPNWQVAENLGITERTVKAHRGRVMEKMQAESLVHLIHMARELSLVPSRS